MKRRSTPAQRRASQRLKAIAQSLHPPRETALARAVAEARGPAIFAAVTLATAAERFDLPALPDALSQLDPLPAPPVLSLGKKLADAIARLDAIQIPLDLLTVEPGQ